MSQIDRILNLLADGQFHSGEKIGEILGITRSAVSQTLKRLLDPNLDLQAIRNRGYRIPGGLELLDETQIRAQLGAAASQLSQLEILKTVDSTNRYANEKKDMQSGFAILSEQQTAGRGRFGRTWISPFGRNIYLSLLWHFPAGSTSLTGLSLAVGVAVVRALESYGLKKIGLKWPNDIVYLQQKLGGILVEVNGDAAGLCQVVIGIGLNVQMSKTVDTTINQPWVDIQTINQQKPQRNRLTGLILRELLLMLPEFQRKGLAAFRQEWEQLDVLYGQAVNIKATQETVQGTAQGIDEFGHLRVKIDDQIRHFNSGEVNVRYAGSKIGEKIAISDKIE